jgi:TPR repeat protein
MEMNKLSAFFVVLLLSSFGSLASQEPVSLFNDGRYKEANEIFQVDVDSNMISQFFLGLSYLNGLGVDIEIEKGREYIKKSAKQGYHPAHLAISSMHINGLGVVKNVDMAYAWLLIAKMNSHESNRVAVMEKEFEDYFTATFGKEEYSKAKEAALHFANLCIESGYSEDCFTF